MSSQYFTISLNPEGTTIDDVDLSDGLKQAYVDAFVILTKDPTAIDASLVPFESYYAEQNIVALANVAATTNISLAFSLDASSNNNVVQMDMDGNLMASNDRAIFSNTKEEAKNILGSTEKISANEILIADSVNKRAIIVDIATKKIKWMYNSDRYVIDAHIVLQNTLTVDINSSNVASDDITLNKGQTIIWENKLSTPVTIYSGNIDGIDITTNFDENLYGDLFKSIVLNQGDRWAYEFASTGDFDWFTYPNALTGTITVSNYKMSSANQFILLESDGLESSSTSRAIKIDSWGNVIWSMENFLVKPRDIRSLINNKVLIST
jgi:hypothetical protein